ncbi:hypothetical protein DWF00_15625 [Bosea caraganae]|uniref:Uncharacterized protein n=1 Tax=Bosea caraganae TaxID=2763117 RepID=A0A370L6L3_9HYPH|nr:hypothetical protein DWE98_11760 [Bosea caraganae]RDJ25818.1 hypothetical protein DWF00_15625 [Bosea caraganae]
MHDPGRDRSDRGLILFGLFAAEIKQVARQHFARTGDVSQAQLAITDFNSVTSCPAVNLDRAGIFEPNSGSHSR